MLCLCDILMYICAEEYAEDSAGKKKSDKKHGGKEKADKKGTLPKVPSSSSLDDIDKMKVYDEGFCAWSACVVLDNQWFIEDFDLKYKKPLTQVQSRVWTGIMMICTSKKLYQKFLVRIYSFLMKSFFSEKQSKTTQTVFQ